MSLPGSYREWRCQYCGKLQQKYVVAGGTMIVETKCWSCGLPIRLIVRDLPDLNGRAQQEVLMPVDIPDEVDSPPESPRGPPED
jgi:hypothetical protein